MRLLHPSTLYTVAIECKDSDFKSATVSRKQVIAHAWSEGLKYLATKQTHPKMWLDPYELGGYLAAVKMYGDKIGCNFE